MFKLANKKSRGSLLFNFWKCRVNPLVWIFSVVILSFLVGCEGVYKGAILKSAARKVVIFNIKGPGGEDFTKKLGTEINGMGRVVVYGSEFGEPVDSIAAAKIASDCQAHVFIIGEITKSGIVNLF